MGLWKRGQTLNVQLCSISKCKHSNAILHLKHYLVCTAWTQLSHDGAARTLFNLAGHAPPNKPPTHTAWIWESCQAQKRSYRRSCKSLNVGTNTCHDNWGKPQTDTRTNGLKDYMSGFLVVYCSFDSPRNMHTSHLCLPHNNKVWFVFTRILCWHLNFQCLKNEGNTSTMYRTAYIFIPSTYFTKIKPPNAMEYMPKPTRKGKKRPLMWELLVKNTQHQKRVSD